MSELLAVSRIEKAAAEALDYEPEDMTKESYDHYGLAIFSGNGKEIAICDDEEADRAASDYIKESLWSFNPTFMLLGLHTPISSRRLWCIYKRSYARKLTL